MRTAHSAHAAAAATAIRRIEWYPNCYSHHHHNCSCWDWDCWPAPELELELWPELFLWTMQQQRRQHSDSYIHAIVSSIVSPFDRRVCGGFVRRAIVVRGRGISFPVLYSWRAVRSFVRSLLFLN